MNIVREDMQVVGVSDMNPLWRPLMGAAERKRYYTGKNFQIQRSLIKTWVVITI